MLGTGARPAAIRKEYGIQFHNRPQVVMIYDNENAAMRTLEHQRKDLERMNIPEMFWPALVERTVETTVSTWRPVRE